MLLGQCLIALSHVVLKHYLNGYTFIVRKGVRINSEQLN